MPQTAGNVSREVYLPVSDVYEDPHKCPACGNQTVLLEGRWQRDFVAECKDGKSVSEMLDEQIVKSVHAIVCPTCDTRFKILQDDVFRQKKEIVTLKRKISRLQEPTPAGGKKELIQ